MQQFTDRYLKRLAPPETGNRIVYDSQVTGLGLRVTAAGSKSFIFNYRIHGRERRYTVGPYGPDQWTLVRARKRAGELRRMIEHGEDPLAEREDARTAPTVADLCHRFEEAHMPKLRAKTAEEYAAQIRRYILPALGSRKVADITYADIDTLHRKITKAGARYRANRVIATLSKMFALAIRWKMRPDNPCVGVERNQEQKRARYLSTEELTRLTKALAEHQDQQAANIIRLLLLTGSRRSEVQGMQWGQLDLERASWVKPGSTTKQKTEHRVPLSAPALLLLSELRMKAGEDAKHVFPSHGKTGYRMEIERNWADLCEAAGIAGARLHDLRHTFASTLVSAGLSLPTIGALLGHSQPQTTHRYAHLADDPLKAAVERVGAIVTGKPAAEIISLNKRA